MTEDLLQQVPELIMAAAALGTAAFGVVEASRGTFIGVLGVGVLKKSLGEPGLAALAAVYGASSGDALLRQAFRRGQDEIASHLKNGLRLSLSTSAAKALAVHLGQDGEALDSAIADLQKHDVNADNVDFVPKRALLMRAEMAIDARVDAAVAAAYDANGSWLRAIAMGLAVVTGVFVGALNAPDTTLGSILAGAGYGFLIGLAAVPVAPIAHDLVRLLNSARHALDRRPRP